MPDVLFIGHFSFVELRLSDRTEQLKDLMAEHDLSAADVGELLSRSVQTVRCWRCQWDARTIPAHTLLALRVLIAERNASA
jgi:hypothetical protein